MTQYEVIVGNIGTVHTGNNKREALATYKEYVEQSKSGVGRAGGEEVTLMVDGEPDPDHEFIPENKVELRCNFTIQAGYASGEMGDLIAQLRMVVEDALENMDYGAVDAPVKFVGLADGTS